MMRLLSILSVLLFGALPAWVNEPKPWQLGFQDSATTIMDKIVDLHTHLLWVILPIGIFVTVLMVYVVWRFRASKNPIASQTTHHTLLEVVWTAVPVVILFIIAFPSVKLIYFADKVQDAEVTVKVVGNQWYWHYQYPDDKIEFDSRMVADEDLKQGQRRLLEVDHEMVLPVHTNVRLLVTSSAEDVIHSWTIPAFGVKQDAVPGRLREIWVNVKKEGVYYGQCSEICGANHAYMPITVRVVSKDAYKEWLNDAKQKFAQGPLLNTPITFANR